jgi:hypothetical protein
VDPTDARRLVTRGIVELPFGKGKHWISATRWPRDLPVADAEPDLHHPGRASVGVRGQQQSGEPKAELHGVSAKWQSTADRWFDTSQFVNPPLFTYGNVGRTLPDLGSWTSIFGDQDTAISERLKLHSAPKPSTSSTTGTPATPVCGFLGERQRRTTAHLRPDYLGRDPIMQLAEADLRGQALSRQQLTAAFATARSTKSTMIGLS